MGISNLVKEHYEGREVKLCFRGYSAETMKAVILNVEANGMLFKMLGNYEGDLRKGEELFISSNNEYYMTFVDTVRSEIYHDLDRQLKIETDFFETEEFVEIVRAAYEDEDYDINGEFVVYDDYTINMEDNEFLDVLSKYFKKTVTKINNSFRDGYEVTFVIN